VLVSGVALAGRLPWLLFALQAGALADRLDRKRTMLLVDAGRAGLIALIGVLVVLDREQLWSLYLIAFLLGIGETLFDTASQSILPAVVARHDLDRANGRLQAVELTTNTFVGPPIGGLLAGAAIASAFFGSAGLYAMAPLVLVGLTGSFRPVRAAPPRALRHDIAEGLHYLWHHRVLRTMGLMVGVMNLMSSAVTAVLPLYAVRPGPLDLTDSTYGLLLTSFALGAIGGAWLVEPLQKQLGRAGTLVLSVCAYAAQMAILLWANAVAIYIVTLLSGLLGMGWNVITVSLRQRVVPDHLLGRVNSGYRLLAWGTMPIGALLGGVIAQVLNLRAVFAVATAGTVVLLLCFRIVTEDAIREAEEAVEHAPAS
jgi:MFS family permease